LKKSRKIKLMEKYKIYHNPRCSKSRETLLLIQQKTNNIEIIEYLKNPITHNELKDLLIKLKIKAIDIIRTNEYIWKEKYKKKIMNDEEIINIILEFPNLLQRPIVVKGGKAIIGRPPENVLKLFT